MLNELDDRAAVTSEEISQENQGRTVPTMFNERVAASAERTAIRWKNDDGSWGEWTWGDYADLVARAAAALLARGLGRGDRVLLMLRNNAEFHVLDMAALFVGATPVSIYNSSSPDQIEYLANDAAANVAIVEDSAFFEKVNSVRDGIPSLGEIGVIDGSAGDFSFADLLSADPIDLEEAAKVARGSDLATLIYTSGTTGPSKGVMIDHDNVVWNSDATSRVFEIDLVGKRIISYLPMAHIAERMMSHYLAMDRGMEVTCCPDPTEIANFAREIRPHVMFGVPRVWEKIYAGVNAALAADPEKQQKVAEAIEAAAPIRKKMTMGTATQEELETYDFLDAVAFSTIRGLVGLDELIIAATGAAPIPAEMMDWFRTIGVPLSEVYGLSETTGAMTYDVFRVKAGWVGRQIPGCEVRLAEDGEVLCRGGNVFRGYLNQPEKTAEVIDSEGWFHSGDIGEIDDEGYLRIVDRKKELIITSGGKNISPANLEAALKMIPLVGQACAIGDQRPFVSALVTLDPDAAAAWAAKRGVDADIASMSHDPEVVESVNAGVRDAMAHFNNAEAVKKVSILPEEWMPDSDVLTPTSKLKRRGIHARYGAEIEALYQT
jgi:long-chain acyl-CoA synthetase